jgi:hypothetical protein
VSITTGIVALSGATTLGISLASGSRSAISRGTIESGGTTNGSGVGASTSTRAHCLY